MPSAPADNLDLGFDEPRLRMTIAGRFAVRIMSYLGYLLLAAAVLTSLTSDIPQLFWLGVFFALFLLDRLFHLRKADKHFSELPAAGSVNVARYLTPEAFAVLERAYDRSALMRRSVILEVAYQLLRIPEIGEGLRRLDVGGEEFKQKTEELLKQSSQSLEGALSRGERLQRIEALARESFSYAREHSHPSVGTSDLFAVLPRTKDDSVVRLFSAFDIEGDDIKQALIFSAAKRQFSGRRRLPSTLGGMIMGGELGLRHRIMNRAWTSRPTPILDRCSSDLTDLARQEEVGFLIGHQAEYKRLIETLARPVNPNALLVGEAGVGKETLVARVAFDIVKDRVPPPLFDKRLVALHISNLVGGASETELQAKVNAIVGEILAAGNVILYIPEIHNLVKTSGTAYLSAADALIPIIMHNAFPIVGATYPKEFKQLIEPRSDFAAAFEAIRVAEISEADAQKILVYESLILEKQANVVVSFGAIKTAVRLAKKYFRNKLLPSSAEELLKDGVVAAAQRGEKFVGPEAIVSVAETKVNIPIHEAGRAEAETLLRLEETIHKRLIDQDDAVTAVSNALREYRSGLSRRGGPIASFLFVGPTGVGKTELAKIVSRIQFGSEAAMIRFDMTEYQDKQSFYRFIGSPDGNVSGALTDGVLQKPYSLILLDEFEKAFPDILNLFLQVFDDGRLTDNLGRTVDFQNTIIIATSNAHSDIINEALNKGQSMTEIAEYLKRKLVDVFRPELLNRFSKTIVFKDLSPRDIEKIAELNLRDLALILGEQGISLAFDPTAVKQIAKLGYDPAFGARPLRRVIDERIKAALAPKILTKEVKRGDRVTVAFRDETFQFAVSADAG